MNMIPWVTKELEKMMSFSCVLIKVYNLYYKKIVEKEIRLGDISSDDKVLCIGGGSIPCTAIEIASKTGARVEVLDIDPQAVETAKSVISKLKLDNKIKIIQGCGQQMDCSKYSVVHVALQAYPQDKIFQNIWSRAKTGTRILMRKPKENLERFYAPGILNSNFQVSNNCSTTQKYCTMKETYLYTKKEEREGYEKDSIFFSRSSDNNNHSKLCRLNQSH